MLFHLDMFYFCSHRLQNTLPEFRPVTEMYVPVYSHLPTAWSCAHCITKVDQIDKIPLPPLLPLFVEKDVSPFSNAHPATSHPGDLCNGSDDNLC
mmetsp:Transcript_2793/g.5244  ORF Transcript_2793/g.5244 Transcript_2793/m.5244 type:complete len:95 (-) Transcript_2793:152-436(-)